MEFYPPASSPLFCEKEKKHTSSLLFVFGVSSDMVLISLEASGLRSTEVIINGCMCVVCFLMETEV